MKNYDIIVLGGGPGGYVAAIKAAQMGAKVALIEKEVVGGVCLNHGCIPTKTLLKNAKVYKTVQKAQDFGVIINDNISFDWSKMLKRKNIIVKKLTLGIKGLLKKNGVEVFSGFGNVISNNQVEINKEIITAKNLILATGASPIIPPIKGLKEAYDKGIVVTSKELLQIKEAPKTLTIIGGGVIAVEFATIFSSLGSKVIIIEKLNRILPAIDDEVRTTYVKLLKKDGIEIITNAQVTAINDNEITYSHNEKQQKTTADAILVAVGMAPNLGGLEKIQLKIVNKAVETNEKMQTSVANIYAIGDLNGKYMLAHVASAEGIVAALNIMGENKAMRYDRIPSAIYGSPEVAAIGMNEQEVIDKGIEYEVSLFPVAANGRAMADNEKDGFVKLIVDKQFKEIIGAHILAYNASELISEISMTLELEGTAYELAHAIHPHPTLSEMIMEAAHGATGKHIHL